MQFTKPFAALDRTSVTLAGGKGAQLGEMTRAGIPVPPGFVILAQAFERYLEETDLKVEIEARLREVTLEDTNSVDRASNIIRAAIHRHSIPKDLSKEIQRSFEKLDVPFVAVRSSATAEDAAVASWAGELETYLYVDHKHLLERVQQCWSSLFTPRAIFYRFEKKLHTTKISVAVVIQKMVNSEVAGVCFTVHPVTKDHNQMVIEAGYGLGEAIVSGKITPDTYIVEKEDLSIIDANISEQREQIIPQRPSGTVTKPVPMHRRSEQKLGARNIQNLARLCQQIERHYGSPQDIEWAFEAKQFYITQSRPITTL
jgi:pyruvate,water dikinase